MGQFWRNEKVIREFIQDILLQSYITTFWITKYIITSQGVDTILVEFIING